MIRPHFEPLSDNTFRIVHAPEYGASAGILRRIEAGQTPADEAEKKLRDILRKYPWHFEAAWALSCLYMGMHEVRKACEIRFLASQRLLELLPDDDETEILPMDFEKRENRFPLFLLHASAIDHFLISDFELSAALLETLLDLDEEDHLEVSQTLAWCYLALDEPEMFEFVLPDLDEKSPERALSELWADLRFGGRVSGEKAEDFRRRFPAAFREFTADDHPVTEAYLAAIDGEQPSPESRARLLWLKTEHLWKRFPEFPAALKQLI